MRAFGCVCVSDGLERGELNLEEPQVAARAWASQPDLRAPFWQANRKAPVDIPLDPDRESSHDVGLITMGIWPDCSILLLLESGGKVTSGPDPITIGHDGMHRTSFNARSSATPGCSQRGEDRVPLGEQPIYLRDPNNAQVVRCRRCRPPGSGRPLGSGRCRTAAEPDVCSLPAQDDRRLILRADRDRRCRPYRRQEDRPLAAEQALTDDAPPPCGRVAVRATSQPLDERAGMPAVTAEADGPGFRGTTAQQPVQLGRSRRPRSRRGRSRRVWR
jgi:hypothetical protein